MPLNHPNNVFANNVQRMLKRRGHKYARVLPDCSQPNILLIFLDEFTSDQKSHVSIHEVHRNSNDELVSLIDSRWTSVTRSGKTSSCR